MRFGPTFYSWSFGIELEKEVGGLRTTADHTCSCSDDSLNEKWDVGYIESSLVNLEMLFTAVFLQSQL